MKEKERRERRKRKVKKIYIPGWTELHPDFSRFRPFTSCPLCGPSSLRQNEGETRPRLHCGRAADGAGWP